jgi:hypothetical protein
MDRITKALSGMDKRTSRYKKTKAYLEGRARPLQGKTVKFPKHIDWKNQGLDEEMTFIAGYCPCSICGHEWGWECEENDCQCCSSACT